MRVAEVYIYCKHGVESERLLKYDMCSSFALDTHIIPYTLSISYFPEMLWVKIIITCKYDESNQKVSLYSQLICVKSKT